MQEDENFNSQEISETPKKRGRKPKVETSAEGVVAKKRGRPRKNAESESAEQNDSSQQTSTPLTGTQELEVRQTSSLDEVLDTAVKQRRARGRKPSKTNREDGPVWRDTPTVTQEESQTEERENGEESESEIFVYKQKSDDFEFSDSNSQDDNENLRANSGDDDDDEIPTSFSTTDEDLNPDAYRDQRDDDDDNDYERRIAEAREYEKAIDDDEQLDVRQERNNRWQNRDRNDKNNKFRDKQNGRQNNNNRNQNQQQRQNNRQQDFRNNKNRQQQNNNNRNQNQQQRQNNNVRQNQQQARQQQQQQKKSRWNQNQSADSEYINPADLPEWNILKSEKLINEKLAQIFFDKTPSWEMESFENATPISIEEISTERPETTAQTSEITKQSVEKENSEVGDAKESPIQPDSYTENLDESTPLVEAPKTEEETPQIPQKNVSDMNYWELMANANDSAVKKFGLEKGEPTKDETAEGLKEVESSQNAQEEVQSVKKEIKIFDEPNSLILEDCGTIESIDDFDELNKLGIREIQAKFDELSVEYTRGTGKSDLIAAYFKHALKNKKLVKVSGTLDVFQDGLGGAITFEADNYKLKRNSVYVPQIFIDKYGLKRGHTVSAFALPPREFGRENCPFAVAIVSAMGSDPIEIKNTVPFTDLVPYYPTRRIIMESAAATKNDAIPMRAVDLLTPIGFGQRALIVAPPRTGKTVLMQAMAKSIRMNAPDAHLMILLVDERPEEVTDFKRSVDAEVIASTFDEEATSHVHAAEMVISKARRMVEEGRDVIILLDSITRLARAYNALMPNGGRTMSGGVEANALQKPKKFFGSARNIENGGSLTIIGTALVETGSKMDEVIFEEFKGTGNLELHLDRALSDKRIFPAISIEKSGTRKEELLYHPDELSKIYALRRAMKDVPSTDAMEMLVQRLRKVKTNVEFLLGLNR